MAMRNSPAARITGQLCPAHIEAHAQQCHYSVHRLSRLYGCSVRQLERLFKEHSQRSPHQWLHELRMRRAVELLRDGTRVKAAANLLAYETPEHFIHDFTNTFGDPPGKFRLPPKESG